ncbi:MAG: phenylacetate--CoA ligase [Oscillospiraceae bacterium]|nr:phenylacetate--CoA ligase [Oscillospiraceae bacterium]
MSAKENYYQPEAECMSREKMHDLQSERLITQVKHVYANVGYYREKMDASGVRPEDVKSIADLGKLPFLTKDDLREAYPYGLLAVPREAPVRIHSTSGTTGKRVVAFLTQQDIDLWYDCCARALAAAGATPGDVVQISYGYGLFTGGAGLDGGSHKLGSLTLPMSSGFTDRQLQFMCDLGATIICCTPSYAEFLAETIEERGIGDSVKLKAGIFGAEAWSNEMRLRLEQKLGIKAYDIYGLTEITGPGVSFECSQQEGLHINEDHFVAEIINPETGEVLPDGEKGELVFTCLTKQAFPLLRYRTRDISILSRKECQCGRTLAKMSRLMGRSDDMLIIKGVNVFPSQIETVLIDYGLSSNYQLVIDRVNHSDTLEVRVELTPEMFSGSGTVGAVEKHERMLRDAIKNMLGIAAKVKLVNPKTITRSEGKAVRVIDNRKV